MISFLKLRNNEHYTDFKLQKISNRTKIEANFSSNSYYRRQWMSVVQLAKLRARNQEQALDDAWRPGLDSKRNVFVIFRIGKVASALIRA